MNAMGGKAESPCEDLSDAKTIATDPVEHLLLTDRARTVHETEELYLNSAYGEVLALRAGPLSDKELGRNPLLVLYRSPCMPVHTS